MDLVYFDAISSVAQCKTLILGGLHGIYIIYFYIPKALAWLKHRILFGLIWK